MMTTRLSNYERLGNEGKPFPKRGGSAAHKAWLRGRNAYVASRVAAWERGEIKLVLKGGSKERDRR